MPPQAWEELLSFRVHPKPLARVMVELGHAYFPLAVARGGGGQAGPGHLRIQTHTWHLGIVMQPAGDQSASCSAATQLGGVVRFG